MVQIFVVGNELSDTSLNPGRGSFVSILANAIEKGKNPYLIPIQLWVNYLGSSTGLREEKCLIQASFTPSKIDVV